MRNKSLTSRYTWTYMDFQTEMDWIHHPLGEARWAIVGKDVSRNLYPLPEVWSWVSREQPDTGDGAQEHHGDVALNHPCEMRDGQLHTRAYQRWTILLRPLLQGITLPIYGALRTTPVWFGSILLQLPSVRFTYWLRTQRNFCFCNQRCHALFPSFGRYILLFSCTISFYRQAKYICQLSQSFSF